MARRKTLPDSVRAKYSLAERLTALRAELFGERGGPELARRLGLPVRTWYNYEAGVTVPAEVILKIIELTSIEPIWLLHGRGPKFRARGFEPRGDMPGQVGSVGTLLRTALELLEQDERARKRQPAPALPRSEDGMTTEGAHATEALEGIVLIAVRDSGQVPLTDANGPHYLAAQREWLDAERDCRCIRNVGEAMMPLIADGAYVAFSRTEESDAALDGKLVVAWVRNQPIVRWFQYCERYALLRAENAATEPTQILVDLEGPPETRQFRRVLWINTPH